MKRPLVFVAVYSAGLPLGFQFTPSTVCHRARSFSTERIRGSHMLSVPPRYTPGSEGERRRARTLLFESGASSDEEDRSIEWLTQATERLVQSKPGSLDMGKWHEVVSIFTAWSGVAKRDAQAPYRMEALLKRLLDEQNGLVTIKLYNCLLEAWCDVAQRYRNKDALQRAREILVLLQEQQMPNGHSFAIVFPAVCRLEGPLEGRRMIAWMEYLAKSEQNPSAQPRLWNYRVLLDYYGSVASGGRLADGVLRHMKTVGIQPDTLCYNLAIKAWSKARQGRESAEHADQLLEEMKESSESAPDVISYGSVINAWAHSGMRAHAVARAEELFQELNETFAPNTVVVNSVMSAWVKSRSPSAVKRTRELMRQMEQDPDMEPDLISYNTHLHGLSLSSASHADYARQAEHLLTEMEEGYDTGCLKFAPNLFSYNLVLDAYCRSRMHKPAANVLRRLIQRPGVEPDSFSFNQVLTALSKANSIPGRATNCAHMAEELLRYMESAYESGLHPRARPDAGSYAAVLHAHARSSHPDGASRAEALLTHMKKRSAETDLHLKPNRRCYNAVIAAWASQRTLVGARRAEALLQEMQDLCEAGDVAIAPNLVTYNTVLNAWARSGTRCCGRKAELYLNRMWDLYRAGDKQVKPNDFSYNTVINAISKSKNEGKAQQALRMLRRMDQLYQAGNKETRPNAVSYTAVLNSCAFPAVPDPRTRRKALDTAIFTLAELRASRYGQPNHVTYGTFMLAAQNLLPDDDATRREVIERAFHQCCKDGQVGEMVLTNLRNAAPPDLYDELLADKLPTGRHIVSLDDLPLEWRCNVRDKNQRRTRPVPRRKRVAFQRRAASQQLKP